MSDEIPSVDDVDDAFRKKIKATLDEAVHLTPDNIRQLAEAWAWVQTPNQAHGGTSVSS